MPILQRIDPTKYQVGMQDQRSRGRSQWGEEEARHELVFRDRAGLHAHDIDLGYNDVQYQLFRDPKTTTTYLLIISRPLSFARVYAFQGSFVEGTVTMENEGAFRHYLGVLSLSELTNINIVRRVVETVDSDNGF